MSYDSWTCLMVEKGPGMITDKVRASLKMAACNLHLDQRDKMLISNDVCNGIIQTSWDSHAVGARSGILFRAQIDSDTGEYKVNFLLSEDDLKRGAEVIREMEEKGESVWASGNEEFPCPALYQFYDLTEVSGGHRMN